MISSSWGINMIMGNHAVPILILLELVSKPFIHDFRGYNFR